MDSYSNDFLKKLEPKTGVKIKYYVNGELHRDDDKPAIEYDNGDMEWWCYKKGRHRENGQPAVVRKNGNNEWWIDGKRVK